MASIFKILNRLLPFATPGTPVLQDVLHLAAICVVLYFAPQLQARLQSRTAARENVLAHEVDSQYSIRDDGHAENEHQHQRAAGNANAVNNDEPTLGAPNENDGPAFNEDFDQGPNDIPEGQAGPARQPLIPEQRNVGAKKAKALARRDQRRAYHEFQRSQGDAQRAKDAEGAAEREKAQASERERRRLAETALEAKKAREREERRVKEEAERAAEQRRREHAVELVRSGLEADGMCDLFKVAREVGIDDEEWVEKIVRSSGMLSRSDHAMTMITGMGWAVRVSASSMHRLYAELLGDEGTSDADGVIAPERCAAILEQTIRENATPAAV